MRGPPASLLFASWPWPRHTWMLVATYGYDSILAESFAGQTVGLVAPLCPAWHRYLFGHGQPLAGFEDAQEEEYRATAHGQWRGNGIDEFMQ